MTDLVTMFQDGGPSMVVIFAAGVGNLVLAGSFALVALRRRAPAWLVLVPALFPAMLGIQGCLTGMRIAADALAAASPETRQVLVGNGLGVSIFTMMGALVANAATLALAMLGAGAAAAARRSAPPDEALSIRATATALFLATFGTLAWLTLIGSAPDAFREMAFARAETKASVFVEAMARAEEQATYIAIVAGVGSLLGLGAMAPLLRAATRRTWREIGVSAGLVALLLILPMANPIRAVPELFAVQAHPADPAEPADARALPDPEDR